MAETKWIIRIHNPVLSERAMERIKKATAEFMYGVEKEKQAKEKTA